MGSGLPGKIVRKVGGWLVVWCPGGHAIVNLIDAVNLTGGDRLEADWVQGRQQITLLDESTRRSTGRDAVSADVIEVVSGTEADAVDRAKYLESVRQHANLPRKPG